MLLYISPLSVGFILNSMCALGQRFPPPPKCLLQLHHLQVVGSREHRLLLALWGQCTRVDVVQEDVQYFCTKVREVKVHQGTVAWEKRCENRAKRSQNAFMGQEEPSRLDLELDNAVTELAHSSL